MVKKQREVTPYMLDPMSKLAFRIGEDKGKIQIYGKAKGGKEVCVPASDRDFERAEIFGNFISKEEYDKY